MATTFPHNFEENHPAESFVYEWVKDNLPMHWVAYFNYFIDSEECDLILLIPNYGVIVLEIKAWQSEKIIDVVDQNEVVYKMKKRTHSFTSPYRQARRYSLSLLEKIKKNIGKNIIVVPSACYVNISKEEFQGKNLRVICEEDYAILKDDFNDPSLFKEKLLKVIEKQKEIGFDFDYFLEEEMLMVRSIFETNPVCIEWELNKPEEDSAHEIKEECPYSIVTYMPSTIIKSEAENYFKDILRLWQNGTKVTFVSNGQADFYIGLLWAKIKELSLERYQAFKMTLDEHERIINSNVFNFVFHTIDFDHSENVEIIDGTITNEVQSELLNILHAQTLFNKDQYYVEHSPVSTNLLIKAGAGSGKTYSMISRLTFLINKHNMDAKMLYESTYLITFTNEAASNMKRRLQETMQNYYLLTRDFKFFELVEHVRSLNISTIHSLAKRIVQKFSRHLGLGKEVAITTGTYERNQFLDASIENNLRKYFDNEYSKIADLKISMYELKKRIKTFISKLENQNIAISDNLDFGKSNHPLFGDLLKRIIVDTEKEMKNWLDINNKMRLSDLMNHLRIILDAPERPLSPYQSKVRYVFVDEFQDTDNMQIDLIKTFQEQLGFSLFVVGDIKQSIYRFRGAESKAFDRLIPPNSDDPSILNKWGKSFSFNKNYRTDSFLLERLEKSFQEWGKNGLLSYITERDKLSSQIIINNNIDISEFFLPVSVSRESDFEQKFIELLKKELNELESKQNIAILVRDNLQIEAVKELCLKNDIYVEVDKGGNFFKSKPVLDLYKLVLALMNYNSPEHLSNLFTTSYIKKNLDFKALINNKSSKKALSEYFHQILNEVHGFDIKGYAENELKLEPVLSVLWKIRTKIMPWNNYGQQFNFQGKEQSDLLLHYKRNLDLAFEKLIEMSNTDFLTINKIEQYLRIMIFTQQETQEREIFDLNEEAKLICTTVHKAKGLEFNTVILPFNDKEMLKERILSPVEVLVLPENKLGYSIQLETDNQNEKFSEENFIKNNFFISELEEETTQRVGEETRILYVAATRAIEKFIYFTKDSKAKYSWQLLLQKGEGK
jgi:DNA helicase II / ATP-dependent DNA helicase PcrA